MKEFCFRVQQTKEMVIQKEGGLKYPRWKINYLDSIRKEILKSMIHEQDLQEF